jgi:hypothetical protein
MHYINQLPVYTCTCTRFTGREKVDPVYHPSGTAEVAQERELPRTNFCKHILAVMRVNGDPRYKAPAPPTMPLNHPIGNIEPHESSTYAKDYKGGDGKPSAKKEGKLWATTEMQRKKQRL